MGLFTYCNIISVCFFVCVFFCCGCWSSAFRVDLVTWRLCSSARSLVRELHIVAVLLFMTFMLLVAIVYLNLLVAMMTAGYDKVLIWACSTNFRVAGDRYDKVFICHALLIVFVADGRQTHGVLRKNVERP